MRHKWEIRKINSNLEHCPFKSTLRPYHLEKPQFFDVSNNKSLMIILTAKNSVISVIKMFSQHLCKVIPCTDPV